MQLKKQGILIVLISVFCSVSFMVNNAFGHVRSTRITKVRLDRQGVNIYSIGRPVIKKHKFEKHHEKFFILSFRNAVLVGKGRSISAPYPSISRLIITQFETRPDIVHVVIREASFYPFFVKVSHIAGDRYVTVEHVRSTRITKVRLNRQGVNIYSTGRPIIRKHKFEKHHEKFFILSFRNAVLAGKGRSVPTPFPSILKLVITQFQTRPDIVHVVIRETSFSPFLVKVSHVAGDRYVTVLCPLYHFKVFIDAGHGGNDPGGIGPLGLPESFVNLSVALEVKHLLENRGIHAELDRDSDLFVSLPQRVRKADESNADLFIGLYCNASKDAQLCGTTTYYDHANAYKFSKYLGYFVARRLGLKNDGAVKDNLYVIKNVTKMPAALIEYAYISNKHEERLLASPGFRHRLAHTIADAICNYYILHKTGFNPRGYAQRKNEEIEKN